MICGLVPKGSGTGVLPGGRGELAKRWDFLGERLDGYTMR